MGKDKETVYNQVKMQTKRICDVLERENIKVWVRPETTGKATNGWGENTRNTEADDRYTTYAKKLCCRKFGRS